MPIPITDDQLFTFAKRAEGKVVVITGASQAMGPLNQMQITEPLCL